MRGKAEDTGYQSQDHLESVHTELEEDLLDGGDSRIIARPRADNQGHRVSHHEGRHQLQGVRAGDERKVVAREKKQAQAMRERIRTEGFIFKGKDKTGKPISIYPDHL